MINRLFGGSAEPKLPALSAPKYKLPPQTKVSLWSEAPTGWQKRVTKTELAVNLAKKIFSGSAIPGGETPSVEEINDALGDYKVALNDTAEVLKNKLVKWKEERKKVIQRINMAHVTMPKECVHEDIQNKITSFVVRLWRSPDLVLHEIETQTKNQADVFRAHLQLNYEKLNATAYPERFDLEMGMCHDGISITTDLIQMIDNIKSEIDLCISMEYGKEKVTSYFTNLLLSTLATYVLDKLQLDLNLSLPEFDINNMEQYRNGLYNQISHERSEIELYETLELGLLDLSLGAIEAANSQMAIEEARPATPRPGSP